jgi:hypothetical protein
VVLRATTKEPLYIVVQLFCSIRIVFLIVQCAVFERGKGIEAVPMSRM